MKLNIPTIARLTVIVCGLSAPLMHAQTTEASSQQQGQPATSKPPKLTARQELMSQFDLNKNGKLEPAEREAYLKHLEDERKKFIQQFDTNGDGVLDEEERNAARAFAFQKKLEQKAAAQTAAPAGVQTSKPSATSTVPAK